MKSEIYKKVEESINAIYELTKDGYEGEFASMGYITSKIVMLLKNKGVLEFRTGKNVNNKKTNYYKWKEGAMQPTNLFIQKMTKEYQDFHKEKHQKSKNKYNVEKSREGFHAILKEEFKPEEKKEIPMETETKPTPRNLPDGSRVLTTEDILAKMSDAELWQELKRRGWMISNGKLVKQQIMC